MRRGTLSLRARYVFPVESPPIADACVTIQEGRIASVGPASERSWDIDLGNVAIVPGFVNAHTHLELDPFENECTDPGLGLVDWLKQVTMQRRSTPESALQDAAKRHVRLAVEAGTTLLADVTTAGSSWSAVASAPLRGVVFAEMLGLKRDRGLQTSHSAWQWIGSVPREAQVAGCARPGLSPHAPYSTAGWLYHKAASSRLPLTTHLAESPEELRLLESHDGPMRDFLESIGAWDEDWEPIGPRPSDYIRKGELRNADWLVAHGTYLDPEDFWQFRPEAAPDGQRVAVAYCPRTHARFGHAPHPYRTLLERGAIVCVGTDSLASTPSLSVLEEIRFLHARDQSVPGALLLAMGTLFGAWALRADTTTGSLKPGKSADLAVVDLPDRDEADPFSLLLDSDQSVSSTMFEGDFVAGPWTHA